EVRLVGRREGDEQRGLRAAERRDGVGHGSGGCAGAPASLCYAVTSWSDPASPRLRRTGPGPRIDFGVWR
ncbi:MAG: hypothetical protein WCI95_09950, partial [bacterium]